MRGDGQKGLILMVKEQFLAEIDAYYPKLGFSDRASFIRAAVHEYLQEQGVKLPMEYRAAPPRTIHKGGRPPKAKAPKEETIASTASIAAMRDDTVMLLEMPLLRAAAGSPLLADAEMVEVERDYGNGRFLLELRGDSMEPRFADRQRIVMRDKSTLKRPLLKYGEFYAFVVDGRITFKQWAKGKVLRSLNAAHPDIPADEDTDWIGWFDAMDNG